MLGMFLPIEIEYFFLEKNASFSVNTFQVCDASVGIQLDGIFMNVYLSFSVLYS